MQRRLLLWIPILVMGFGILAAASFVSYAATPPSSAPAYRPANGTAGPEGAVTNTPTATPTCGGPSGTPGPWQTVSPVPTGARAIGATSDGIYAYAAGGLIASSST